MTQQEAYTEYLKETLERQPTKREQFAMAAMQGNIKAFHDCDVTDFGEMASDCVMIADALIAELAKVKV